MTEKLKKASVQKLIKEINDNEFLETGDLFVRSNKDNESLMKIDDAKSLATLYSIYRKAEKGATIVCPNMTLRECYMFLKGYREYKDYFTGNPSLTKEEIEDLSKTIHGLTKGLERVD